MLIFFFVSRLNADYSHSNPIVQRLYGGAKNMEAAVHPKRFQVSKFNSWCLFVLIWYSSNTIALSLGKGVTGRQEYSSDYNKRKVKKTGKT